jgi:hypothetical protein
MSHLDLVLLDANGIKKATLGLPSMFIADQIANPPSDFT